MKLKPSAFLMRAALCAALATPLAAAPQRNVWPGFRGDGSSITAAANLPLTWSPTENVAWERDLAGYGQSSPVIWKDRIFVSSVDGPMQDQLLIHCLDFATGAVRWTRQLKGSQGVATTDYVARAAPTPLVDGKRVYLFFETGDLIALNHQGEVQWQRSLVAEYGQLKTNHGVGSSPVMVDGALVVLVAHLGGSYLLSVDPADGKTRWKADSKIGACWSTPAPVTLGERKLLIVNAGGPVTAIDPKNGSEVWSMEGFKGNTVPSPTISGDLAVVGSSDRNNNAGIRLRAEGPEVVWRSPQATCSFGSPLVHEGYVYMTNRTGVAYCLDLKTGAAVWDTRLSGSCWAAPFAAGDRIYFFSVDGGATVVRSGAKLEVLATNKLPVEGRLYGVAAVDGAIVYRTGKKVVRLSAKGAR